MADVPLYVISEFSSSERRITPSWSIAQLKKKLEPITGIPPSCQVISLKIPPGDSIPVEAADEESVYMQSFNLVPYAELHVSPIVVPFSLVVLGETIPSKASPRLVSNPGARQAPGAARRGLFTSAPGVKDHGNCSELPRKSETTWAFCPAMPAHAMFPTARHLAKGPGTTDNKVPPHRLELPTSPGTYCLLHHHHHHHHHHSIPPDYQASPLTTPRSSTPAPRLPAPTSPAPSASKSLSCPRRSTK